MLLFLGRCLWQGDTFTTFQHSLPFCFPCASFIRCHKRRTFNQCTLLNVLTSARVCKTFKYSVVNSAWIVKTHERNKHTHTTKNRRPTNESTAKQKHDLRRWQVAFFGTNSKGWALGERKGEKIWTDFQTGRKKDGKIWKTTIFLGKTVKTKSFFNVFSFFLLDFTSRAKAVWGDRRLRRTGTLPGRRDVIIGVAGRNCTAWGVGDSNAPRKGFGFVFFLVSLKWVTWVTMWLLPLGERQIGSKFFWG